MEFKRQTEDLDSSFDSLSDEISDECSPNSILDYSTVGSQEGNVLLNNKGKIRDLRNFKLELVEIFSKHELTKNALTPICDRASRVIASSRPKCKVMLQTLRSPFSNLKYVRSSLIQNPNRIMINEERNNNCLDNDKIIFQVPLQSKNSFALESISSLMRNSRSATRKVSSSRILNLLQKSIYFDDEC